MKSILVVMMATFIFQMDAYAAEDQGHSDQRHHLVLSLEMDSEFMPEQSLELQSHSRRRPPRRRTYFDWGRGRDGTGYCYEFFRNGRVANGGQAVSNRWCERVHPSYYDWETGRDGYYYCYQFTPYHVVMNQGRPVPERFCRY